MQRTEDCSSELYSIREATEHDVIDLAILGKEFVKESQNSFLGWNSSKVYDALFDAIQREDFHIVVLQADTEIVGMLVCFVTPCFFSDVKQAVEIVWYVTPEHRGSKKALQMLEHYEQWAKEQGAVCVNLVNLEILRGDRVAKLYKRLGYHLVENTFMKGL